MQQFDGIKMKGSWVAELIGPQGETKKKCAGTNLITTVGKALAAELFKGDSTDYITHIALGDDDTTPDAADTALGNELGRVSGTLTRTSNQVTLTATIPAGTATGTIEEAGILNAASSGDLFSHFLLGPFTKSAADSLTVAYTVTFS